MRDDFHLVDLRSQAASVQSLLRGRSGAEKLEWFSLHGSITPRPKEMPDERQSYWFESRMGVACCSSGRKVYFEQLIDNPSLYERLSRNAHDTVLKRFSLAANAAALEALYREALSLRQ